MQAITGTLGAYAVVVMKTTCMNPTIWEANDRAEEAIKHESTYALLVRSEEKERTFLETALCILCALSAIAAIWQFAQQPIALPLEAVTTVADATQVRTMSSLHAPHIRG
jgi:hypothetical protein